MKRFHFTLEALRTLRERQEREAMEGYAQALLARQSAFDRLEAIRQELRTGWQELRGQLTNGCKASQAAHAQNYHRSLDKQQAECALALGIAERRVNAALNDMLAARRQREMVDTCFEKQKARHRREEARESQKILDDLTGRRSPFSLSWNQTGVTT